MGCSTPSDPGQFTITNEKKCKFKEEIISVLKTNMYLTPTSHPAEVQLSPSPKAWENRE